MSFEPQFPGLYSPEQGAPPIAQPSQATEKQVAYARALALHSGDKLPAQL